MRTKEKIYLGHPNLKRLLSSVPFNNFLSDKYQTRRGLEWYDAISEALAKLLRADTGADKIKGAFQQSKLCSAEVAKQIVTLVEIYEGTESSKQVSWKNYNVFYKEESRAFKKHFRQYKIEQSKEQLPEESLKGLWTVYSIRHGAVFRSFLEVNFKKELHIYHLMSKGGRLTYCDIDSRKNNRGITIKGDLEGTLWHYEVNGRFDRILNGRVNIIRGMVTITHEDQLGICPVLMWRDNESTREIEDLEDTTWGKIRGFKRFVPGAESFEKSLMIYYRYLIENAENVYDPRPAENLNGWIKQYLRKRGRTKFDSYQKALKVRKWVSLSRQSNDPDKIRVFYWSFDFHPLRQAIIVKRVLKEGEYSEIVFMGEMKFHNDRFWIEFDSGDRHKVMMLQSTGNAYPGNLYFLAMGSAGFINFVNDPGDMLTEIVVPMDHLPKEYHGRYSLTYDEFKHLDHIPLDLRLYLNHRDHSILSFDNPNSIKSSLQKQMEAISYQGKYHVYAYHRHLDEAYRITRFTLEIDRLAVATLKKVYADEPGNVYEYNGLAEESQNNLHIALEHLEQARSHKKQTRQEARLIVDTSQGHRDRAVMTGIVSDADREGNPMSLPCVLVRMDNYEEDFYEYEKRFKSLVNPDQTENYHTPRAHCFSDSEEYQLLEELLWTRQRPFLKKRFPHLFHQQKPERARFLETYFDMIGGVFYTDYSKENRRIQQLLNQQLNELMLD